MRKFPFVLLFLLNFFPLFAAAETITIATIERPPFSFTPDSGERKGFTVEVVEEIAVRLGLGIEWKEYTVFSQMLDDVSGHKVDLAAANISVTSAREKIMDFSQPIYGSGLQILVPANSVGANFLKIIWESGIVLFLLGALAVLLVVAHLVWFFERGGNMKHDYFRDDYWGGIWDAFWWAFIIVTMGGFENERPQHYIGRVLAVFWVLTSLFFISTLTAKITTALTVAELSTSINSYEDLRGKSIGTAKGTTPAAFLDTQNILYKPYEDFTAALADLEEEKLEAIVGPAAVSQYYAANDGQGKVRLAGPVFAPDYIALAFPEDSPYFERINSTLITMQEDGTFQAIRETYFGGGG